MLISYYRLNKRLSLIVGDNNDDCYVSIATYFYPIKIKFLFSHLDHRLLISNYYLYLLIIIIKMKSFLYLKVFHF